MKFVLSVIFGMMLSANAMAEWATFGIDPKGIGLVDIDSLKPKNGFVKGWTLIILNKDKRCDFLHNQVEADCKNLRLRDLTFKGYKNEKLIMTYTPSSDAKWKQPQTRIRWILVSTIYVLSRSIRQEQTNQPKRHFKLARTFQKVHEMLENKK